MHSVSRIDSPSSPVRVVVISGQRPSVRSLVRACAAAAIGVLDRTSPVRAVASEWPLDDGALWLLQRSATAPTSMTNAPALIQTVMPDFLATLTGQSAAARVFRDGLQLAFDHYGQIAVPTLRAD